MNELSTEQDADDVIAEAREAFQQCQDAENENRRTALDDIKFAMLQEQWPDAVKKQRAVDQRPMLTINKLRAFIRQVVNDSRQNKPSIKVNPIDNNADIKTANVLSGIIRNIESVSNADVAYDTGVEQAVSGGFGYWRVKIGYAYDESFDLDILIDRITNQFSVYGDPNSTAADSSDWDVCFVTDRIPKKVYERKYKGKSPVNWDSSGWREVAGDWLNDDGVLIAEWWRRYDVEREVVMLDDGRIFDAEDFDSNSDMMAAAEAGLITEVKRKSIKSKRVTQTIISGAEVLEEEKEFPGCYIPIVPVYGDEILVEGKRYFRSLINPAKDAQMAFNFWRSAAAELVALAPRVPWIGPSEAFSEDENWATANTASHAYLVYGGNIPPQRLPLDSGPAAGALQEAMNASDDIKSTIGMFDASLGARSNETSGRAILARQREGDVATFHFIDNVTRAIRHTGKILIGLIPKVYSGERIMRVLGEDGISKNVPVNKEYPADAEGNPVQAQSGGGQGMMPMEENEGAEGAGHEMAELGQTIMMMHDLSIGKYDVTVTSGPSYTTRRAEAAAEQMQFLQSFPQAATIIGDIVAANLDWPQSDKIAERIAKATGQGDEQKIPPELQQQIDQGQQLIQQLQTENEKLKAEQTNQQAQSAIDAQKVQVDMQKAEVERLKVQTAQYEAETNRIEAETSRMQTEIQVAGAQQKQALGLPIQ